MIRLIVSLLALVLLVTPTVATSQVRGQYAPSSGKNLTLHLSVPKPAPAALILTQQVTGGPKLVAARPAPVGGQRSASTVKWLFKRPHPGNFSIQMQFTSPVQPGQLHGSINYRDPATGSRMHTRIGN